MGGKTDRFMPLEIEPWTKKTARLPAAARGAYMDLILAQWRGESLPANDDDALMRLARCTEKEWASVREKLLPYFEREGDVFIQKRASEEKAKANQIYENKASNGQAGGKASAKQRRSKKKANGDAIGKANPKQQAEQTPSASEHISTLEHSPTGEIQPSAGADAPLKTRIFGECLAWLGKVTKKPDAELRSLLGKWCSQHGDGPTLEAIAASQVSASIDPIPYIIRVLSNTRRQAAAGKPMTAADPMPTTITRDIWVLHYRGWLKHKVWPSAIGCPPPGQEGCRCPPDVIEEVDLEILPFLKRPQPTEAA